MVVPNRQLLEWSVDLAAGKRVVLPHHFRPDRVKRFKATADAAGALPEVDWPERPSGKRRKRDRDFERRVESMIKTREQVAAKLDIEGSLIAPRAVLEALAAGEADPADVLLKWQRSCLNLVD
jgi:hypothetical protein